MRSYSSSMSPERNPLLQSCEFLDKIILMLLMSWWDSRWGKRYQGQFILQNRNGPSLLLCQPIDIRSLVLLLALPILLWSSIFGPYRSVDVIRILKSPNCLLDSFLKFRLLSRCQLLLCLRPRLCLFLYLWCFASGGLHSGVQSSPRTLLYPSLWASHGVSTTAATCDTGFKLPKKML